MSEIKFDKVINEIKQKNLTRRDILKLSTLLASSSLYLNPKELKAQEDEAKSNARGKIVIIGGGLAGISTAARLSTSLSNPDITIVEPNPKSVSYQSGNSLLALGVFKKDEILYNTKSFVPSSTKLLKDKAIEFNPETNKISLESGSTLEYDFLVIATGLSLDFGAIKGLEDLGEFLTLDKVNKAIEFSKETNINSIYNTYLAQSCFYNIQKFIKQSNKASELKAIFTHPNTLVKSEGTSKEMIYILNALLMQNSTRDNVNLSYYTNSFNISSIDEYNKAFLEQFDSKELKYNFGHNLIEIDTSNKIAYFDKHWEEKGEYDQDLEKYTKVIKNALVEIPYDFLHITPPMKSVREIRESALCDEDGWVLVDKETLQHQKYKNIFSLGDTISAPMGKTGGSIRKQYKVLVDNLISFMEGKELEAKYDGYTVYPLITDIGKVVLTEYNWTKKPAPTFPLNPTEDRYIWWLLEVYLLKPLIQHGFLSGKI